MENPQNHIMSILKINDKIKRNLFGLSFKDDKIEQEYLETEMRINLTLKIILHLSYLVNFTIKIIQGKFRSIMYTNIIQAIFTFLCIISIVGYYVSKKIRLKKFFDYGSAYSSYIYQIIFSMQIYSYGTLIDKYQRFKSINLLVYLSIFEVLLSYESSIFFPALILIINNIIKILIFTKYEELNENGFFILSSTACLFSCILYKRYTIELNRVQYIQQYIFKKYSLYYYDLINNMNGYQFSIRNEKILKYNENFKIDILKKINDIEKNQDLKEKMNLIDNINQLNKYNFFNNQKPNSKESRDIKLNLVNNIDKQNVIENKYKKLQSKQNEETKNFLKSLIASKIENEELFKFIEIKKTNLYDIYCIIEKYEFNNIASINLIKEDLNNINITGIKNNSQNELLKNNFKNSEENPYQINNFKFLGEFENIFDNSVFEVYLRKLNEYDNLIDFSIYNITKIKEAEKVKAERIKAENELKNKFFAKIAHEFKTPINSVLGLISKIKFKLELMVKDNENIKADLYQIELLSNYTIF